MPDVPPSAWPFAWPIMRPAQFRDVLRQYGPALALWPARDRAAALRLLRVSRGARTALADALAFVVCPPQDDAALQRMQAGLRRRMPALAPARPAWSGLGVVRPGVRVAALAACAVAGIVVGLRSTDQVGPDDVLAPLQVAPFGQTSQ